MREKISIRIDVGGKVFEQELSMPEDYIIPFEKAFDIVGKKNADYSTEADPFRNFRESAKFGVSPSKAVLVRISDKMSRIYNFFDKGEYQVKDEAVTDTIVDAINYLAILYALIKEEVE